MVQWIHCSDLQFGTGKAENTDSDDCARELVKQGVLLPLLLEAGVDLYLCGHHHIYERTRYRRLTHVMAGGDNVAFEGLLDQAPNKYSRLQDSRQGYTRFTLTDKSVRGEAVDLNGECIDTWAQRLNR